MRLSEHFTLAEVTRSTAAKQLGLPVVADEAHVQRLRELCTELLQPIRDALGPLRVTSGFRSEAVNRAVGGSETSAHLSGWAADVVPVRATPEALMRWLSRSGLRWDQAILYPGHVHLGLYRPVDMTQRRQLLQTGDGKRFEVWEGVA